MKRPKYLIIILFLFSTKVYSQHLEQADINVFEEHLALFPDIIYRTDRNYFRLFHETFSSFLGFYGRDGFDLRYGQFKEQFENLLIYDVPEIINIQYNSMGWNNNGHKKVMTIFFGAKYIGLQEELNHFYLILERILEQGFYEEEGDLGDIQESDVDDLKKIIETIELFLNINNPFNEQDLNMIRKDMEFVYSVLDILHNNIIGG